AGDQRWYVVFEDTDSGRALLDAAQRVLASAGATVTGALGVEPGRALYTDVIDAAEGAGATAVMLLLGPRDQIPFVAQTSGSLGDLIVVPYPYQVTQTRDYLAAETNVGGLGLPR